jgi:hypothetical protein
MPVVRATTRGGGGGEGEGESIGPGAAGLSGTSRDLTRLTNNLTLADHIGRFIAGEVANQFQNENLADLMKGKNMIMISGSWG